MTERPGLRFFTIFYADQEGVVRYFAYAPCSNDTGITDERYWPVAREVLEYGKKEHEKKIGRKLVEHVAAIYQTEDEVASAVFGYEAIAAMRRHGIGKGVRQ